jgi:hypothetical protein
MTATGTYSLIGTTTTSSSAASVTFSGLSGYRDYVLLIDNLFTNTSENVYMEINGDTTTSNYSLVAGWGISTTVGSTTRTDSASIIVGYNNGPSSTNAMAGVLYFQGAGATDKHKLVIQRTGVPTDRRTGLSVTRWANNSAITSIKLKAEASYFLNGAVFSLFGIVS